VGDWRTFGCWRLRRSQAVELDRQHFSRFWQMRRQEKIHLRGEIKIDMDVKCEKMSSQLPKQDGMGFFAVLQCAETWNITEGKFKLFE